MADAVAITIGNFDGAHLGHAALVQAGRQSVGSDGRVVVLSFDPHPAVLLRPEHIPPRLTTFEQRREALQTIGADVVHVLRPDEALLSRTPSEFLDWLAAEHQPRTIVEGDDFRFGRGRAGDVAVLRELAAVRDINVIIVPPVEIVLGNQHIVRASSSLIRWLLERGRVRDGRRVLGRPYELAGNVVKGDQRGRDLDMPTANLDHGDLLLPADGVYAGSATLPTGEVQIAAISVGAKPTFNGTTRVCEAHLLDWHAPLDQYDWPIRLRFHAWVRDQLRFDDIDALCAQMQRDLQRVREICTTGAGSAEHGAECKGGAA